MTTIENLDDFGADDAARDAETEFVFGAVAASDGTDNLIISLACDWRGGDGYMSDSYSEAQRETIEQTLAAAGIEADEYTESCWALDSHTAEEARELLRAAPHFHHDAAFERKHIW